MDIEKDYDITTTDSIIAAFVVNNRIEEMVINNKQVKLLLALDAEADIGMIELVGSIYSKTVVNGLVAMRWISAENLTDIDDMLNYCSNVQAAAEKLKAKAAEDKPKEVNANGSALQQAADTVNYIQQTTDLNDEVVQGLNDVVDKLQATSNCMTTLYRRLLRLSNDKTFDDDVREIIMSAVYDLEVNK